jgi:hypothetical protein
MSLRILIILMLSLPTYGNELGCGIETIPKALLEYGCGCGYSAETKSESLSLLQSKFSFNNPKMYIDNKLVSVKPISVQDLPHNPKIGDSFIQIYGYGSSEIIFKNVVTFVCPLDSESCEVTKFKSTLSITKGSCKVKNIEVIGDCGC